MSNGYQKSNGCEALALSGRAACTKPMLAAAAVYLLETLN